MRAFLFKINLILIENIFKNIFTFQPFRLTPQIQGLMDPFKRHGIFKDTMIDSLQKMEANQDVLMAALSGNFEFPAQKQFSY